MDLRAEQQYIMRMLAFHSITLLHVTLRPKFTLIVCLHRRRGQDKTVLSCPCRRCEHICRQDKTVLSCLDPVCNFQVFSNP